MKTPKTKKKPLDKKYRVPKEAITEKGLQRLLLDEFRKEGSMRLWAEKHGITSQVVSAFMRKVQTAGFQIPEAFGYRPQVVFLPVDMEPIATAYPQRKRTANPSKKTDPTKPPIHNPVVDDRKETKERLKDRDAGKKKKDKKKKDKKKKDK